MGNNASQLGEDAAGAKNLQHFDHTFKGQLHTSWGPVITQVFGAFEHAKRPIQLVCAGSTLSIIEQKGAAAKTRADLDYSQVTALTWDHANSEVKVVFNSSNGSENFLILTMANTIEFEAELKLRLSGMVTSNPKAKPPTTMYVGVFAGATKPKPFQRKRPNLSKLPAGKLPPLRVMREMAIDLHRGSYKPCPQGDSRRVELAFQHIYEGANAFFLQSVKGAQDVALQWRSESSLTITEDALIFRPKGTIMDTKLDFPYVDISDWISVDNDSKKLGDSGIQITNRTGEVIFFGVEFVRDVKHTLEYFWNKFKVRTGGEVKLGSTHGRPLVSVTTLSGEVPAPPDSDAGGTTEVVDLDGRVVRPGGKMVPRSNRGEPLPVPPINRDVKPHWNKVVLHQGWLLKQGGLGVGAAKSWLKRYFVLYKTSQGHFLTYYSDFTECPLFSTEKNHRNFVDMAKCTFIRPGSNKQDNPDTPPHCFDIVTIEREWTLCAENNENAQRWLKLLTKAVDEDVAILPDEEVVFNVKPKVDPLGVLPSTDYSTCLKVSAHGISVTTPHNDKEGNEVEHYFWIYTDFYKWTLLSQSGKLALLVNVFADATFTRRIEYIFRNKDALRLATAIEFFIEKFMCLMHIRLESMELGAYEETADGSATQDTTTSTRMHQLEAEDVAQESQQQYGDELDLLGLDMDYMSVGNTSTPAAAAAPGAFDIFGDSAFNAVPLASSTVAAPAPVAVAHDDFAASQPAATPAGDLFPAADVDPFAAFNPSEPAPVAAEAPVEVKIAPPLTAEQDAQHRTWLIMALSNNGGPLYDDGTLQVATKVETRGSQCRFSFMHINQTSSTITDFSVTVTDPAGLMRFELGQLASSQLEGLARVTQIMMLECLQAVAGAPQVTFTYVDSVIGRRTSTIDLPLVVTSFNEPLVLTAQDFIPKWQALIAPGQEAQEVLKVPYALIPAQVHGVLSTTLRFARIEGLPDATEFVIYGAATLRTGALTEAGDKVSVGCMVKIEMNVQANAMRVTLRCVQPAASQAILRTVKDLLL